MALHAKSKKVPVAADLLPLKVTTFTLKPGRITKLSSSKRYEKALKNILAGKPAPKWLRSIVSATLTRWVAQTAGGVQRGKYDAHLHTLVLMLASAETTGVLEG